MGGEGGEEGCLVWRGVKWVLGLGEGGRYTLFIHALLYCIFGVGVGGVVEGAAEAGCCHGSKRWFAIAYEKILEKLDAR